MYNSDNTDGVSENVNVDYIKKALWHTIEDYPHFKLSKQAINSLELLPKLKNDGLPDSSAVSLSRSNTTLYSVLNKCKTMSGQRLLSLWLQHPLTSKEHIDRRLDIVEHLVQNNELRTTCYEQFLKRIPDLLRICCRISKEKCTILDLVKIYNTYKSAQSLYKTFLHLESTNGQECPQAVKELFSWINKSCLNLADFSQLLEDSLVLDKPDDNNEFLLKPKFNDDIAKITDELDSVERKARRELERIEQDVGLEAEKSIKLEIDSDRGFDVRVTRQNEMAVRGNSQYTQSSQIKKDGYRFTTKLLSKLSNSYVELKAEYSSVAKCVYHDIISKAVMYDDLALELSMGYTVLDVFVAFSMVAVSNNYIRPLILDSDAGKIEIERLRHPCVENQPDVENYVPNDIMMNKLDKKFHIVTGPNMGGKSTYIKSIAIGVIMAQCGSLIPADDGKISIIDGVYTRVGAGDRQSEGISTFMEEMMDMSSILNSATENSMVIIDELGRGTSTFDGFGLAWSITKHLVSVLKCYGVFATHFHELTELAEEIESVGNLHVKAFCDDDKLSMLYNVDRGVCDESYGINVARYTEFPEHVIKMAQDKLKQFEEVPGFKTKREVRDFVKECVKDLTANRAK